VKIKLNEDVGVIVKPYGYTLDATQQYVIDLKEELEFQAAIARSFQVFGRPPAMKDWYDWLEKNGFSSDLPDPTNQFVEPFYGAEPLWKTDLSQGIVVKAVGEDDYFVVMECSRENEGYKYTRVILTPGGCMDGDVSMEELQKGLRANKKEIKKQMNPYASCPCRSGEKYKFCCGS